LLDPLSIVRTIAAELEGEGSALRTEQAQGIADAVSQIDGALRELLEFTLISLGGGVPIQRRHVDLKLLCERVLDTMGPSTPHGVVFTCASAVEGEWDPDRLAAMLTRLVTVAAEQRDRQRTVRVMLQGLHDRAVLEVSTPRPPLDRALLPFAAESAGRRRSLGAGGGRALGLGLYLSREIARSHGGRIDVRSDPSGVTTFSVTLPLGAP
jgi:signal transduction histidine kinase